MPRPAGLRVLQVFALPARLQFVLESLLGAERFRGLDLFMAGDDVKEKKPDPTIYRRARGGAVGGHARVGALAPCG